MDAAVHAFCSSLITDGQFRRVRKAVETCGGDKVFVFPTHNKKSVARLQDLGYPDGFSGPQINDSARLIAMADVHSALIDKRSYKKS